MATQNNERFARIIAEAFSTLGVTQAEFQKRGGPSDTTLRKIVAGDPVGVSARTLNGLDKAFSWQPGSAARTLAGGDPMPADQETADILRRLNEMTPERIAEGIAQERELGIQYPAGVLDIAAEIWDLIEKLSKQAMENGAGPDLQRAIERAMEVSADVLPAMVLNSPDAPRSGDFIKQLATTSMKIKEGLDHADSPSDATEPDASPQGDEGQEAIVDVTWPPNRFPAGDDELPLAARTAKPGYRKGQAEQGDAAGDVNQDVDTSVDDAESRDIRNQLDTYTTPEAMGVDDSRHRRHKRG
ncbi:hypothetical protein JVX93_21520 [Mycolicibacterium boenickei]|nr:hypothetical protein JVX93_21520 [Mycolicibacterium boenickei]